SSYAILGRYASGLADLVERMSVSASIAPPSDELRASIELDVGLLPDVYEANRRRNADEPLRLKLTLMLARVESTRRLTAARDAGKVVTEGGSYTAREQLERDLLLVRKTLISAGARHACRTTVEPMIEMVRAHGLYGYLMDVRDHAHVHRSAVDDIATRLGIAPLEGDVLRAELAQPRPIVTASLALSDDTTRVLDTFRAVRTIQEEMGELAASTYIVSMTT